MPYKDPIKAKEYKKEYYIKNKEKWAFWRIQWRIKNKEYLKKYYKEYHKQNKDKANKAQRERNLNIKKSWEGYIPKKTKCQVCSKAIYFNHRGKQDISIFFDHRHENEPIKENPTHWLRIHLFSPENKKIWDQCDFGRLCRKCNSLLRTTNRKQFIIGAIKYIFNKEISEKAIEILQAGLQVVPINKSIGKELEHGV